MINREKVMSDAIAALAKMDMAQLILLNAHLSEHMFNMWQHAELRRVQKTEATVLN